ncbi:MAG: LapA family protein [Burkholderiaceae bacterium]
MKVRTLLIVLALAAMAAFVAANWGAFLAPTTLSLGITTIDAPLGLLMLILLGAFTLAFVAFTAYMQTSAVRESRRNAREMQTQRELADRAEASRFTELRNYLESQLHQMHAREDGHRAAILDRLDRMERNLHSTPQTVHYTPAAHPVVQDGQADHPLHEPIPPLPERRHH